MKHSDEFFERLKVNISVSNDNSALEKEYYQGLARYLKMGDFDNFRNLFDKSVDLEIFMDINKIPNRFKSISELLLNCTERILNEYQISALGAQINILRSCNDFGLFEKNITKAESELISLIKRDKLFLSSLNDLFGRISDSFIAYVFLKFPHILYNYIKAVPNEYFSNRENFMYNIKTHFFNHYTIYGLSVRYLSSVKQFIDICMEKFAEEDISTPKEKFIDFKIRYKTLYYDAEGPRNYFENKIHFVSSENILNNLDNILEGKNYKFYSISMVLLGGLGPQGLGFTYSTPKGEIIEICSDQKETEAIIIKFKQYLKKKFLDKLRKELLSFNVDKEIIHEIINYLNEVINPKKQINYYYQKDIIVKIKDFLQSFENFKNESGIELQEIVNKISYAISLIFKDVKLKDQFMARMDLVAQGKIKSEDIAKLTSLKGKSHYDILRERFFWQYIVDQMYEFYIKEAKLNIT